MDKIQLLPDSVANQIAAGEVIQRPASVIKELVENAIDAGATRIDVLLVEAGKTSIQVIDNGIGMSVTDARLAFERHATSKIRTADDLFSLHTMGFRGEALPSIASVAQVTLKTRQADSPIGVSLHIEGGKVTSQNAEACAQGCNFLVENLFFNVPVRRRFLKTNATELNNIITAFDNIALVYPQITFTLHHNGQELKHLTPGNTHQRIVQIFSKKIDSTLLPINGTTSLGKINGFVTKPESSRKKNPHQYFFVNGRFMKHAYFQKAVQSAYERLIPQGEQVSYFIYFDVDPADIDVNIHPTKTEIKFREEKLLWPILNALVREAIGKNSSIPTIDFDTEGRPDSMPTYNEINGATAPTIDFNPNYNPFNEDGGSKPNSSNTPFDSSDFINTGVSGGGGNTRGAKDSSSLRDSRISTGLGGSAIKGTKIDSNWQDLYDGLDTSFMDVTAGKNNGEGGLFGTQLPLDNVQGSLFGEEIPTTGSDFDNRSKQHLQYRGSYIITTVANGLIVTDQERAHERILYERYMAVMDKGKSASQKLLFPEQVQFTLEEMVALPDILPEIESLGFELADFGGGTYNINSVPAGLEGVNAPKLVSEMVSNAVEAIRGGTPTETRKKLFSSLAISMAANAAIPHGQVLSNDEMEKLIADLINCENSRYTPKGRAIYRLVPHSQMV